MSSLMNLIKFITLTCIASSHFQVESLHCFLVVEVGPQKLYNHEFDVLDRIYHFYVLYLNFLTIQGFYSKIFHFNVPFESAHPVLGLLYNSKTKVPCVCFYKTFLLPVPFPFTKMWYYIFSFSNACYFSVLVHIT